MTAQITFKKWYRAIRSGATNWPRYNHPQKSIAQAALACYRMREHGVERSSPWYGHVAKLP